MNVLKSTKKGSLCAEYKRLGDDALPETVTRIGDDYFVSLSQFIKLSMANITNSDMEACVNLIPTATSNFTDLLCNKLGAGTKERKCLEKFGLPRNFSQPLGSIGGVFFALLFTFFALIESH